MTTLTEDSISLRGAGVVTITQPANKGHRFTLDSLLLADFCRIKPHDRILEPGAGTGIVSIVLAKKFPTVRFVADEIDPQAYNLLRHNIDRNGLTGRIVAIDRDVNHLGRSVSLDAFDVIVTNPPYTKCGSGRISPTVERQTARQGRSAPLSAWLSLQALLKNKGRFILIFPAHRMPELVSLLRERKLEPKRMRFVHSHEDDRAALVMIEAVKAAGIGLEVLPPLVVHEPHGGYTSEMRRIYDLR